MQYSLRLTLTSSSDPQNARPFLCSYYIQDSQATRKWPGPSEGGCFLIYSPYTLVSEEHRRQLLEEATLSSWETPAMAWIWSQPSSPKAQVVKALSSVDEFRTEWAPGRWRLVRWNRSPGACFWWSLPLFPGLFLSAAPGFPAAEGWVARKELLPWCSASPQPPNNGSSQPGLTCLKSWASVKAFLP